MKIFGLFLLLFASLEGFSAVAVADDSANSALLGLANRYRTAPNLTMADLEAYADSFSRYRPLQAVLAPKNYFLATYYLGNCFLRLSRFDEALTWYQEAEQFHRDKVKQKNLSVVGLYREMGYLSAALKNPVRSIDYYKKCDRLLATMGRDNVILTYWADVVCNLGHAFYQLNRYREAQDAYDKGLSLLAQCGSTNVAYLYYSKAIAYEASNDTLLAAQYYPMAIASELKNSGGSILLGRIYRYYGRFLIAQGHHDEGVAFYHRAGEMLLRYEGPRGDNICSTYILMGNESRSQDDFKTALDYYQRALIASSRHFSEPNIAINPSPSDAISGIMMVYALRRKAETLLQWGESGSVADKGKRLMLAYQTITQASGMAAELRNDTHDAENRLTLTQELDYIPVIAIESLLALAGETGDEQYVEEAYRFARQSKASDVRYEYQKNQNYNVWGIADSLKQKLKKIEADIANCEFMLKSFLRNGIGDTAKVNFWEEQLFLSKRDRDQLFNNIKRTTPQLSTNIAFQEIANLEKIRKKLHHEDNIVEYILSKPDDTGEQKLFVFVLNDTGLFHYAARFSKAESLALQRVKKEHATPHTGNDALAGFNQFGLSLFTLYRSLVQPVEKYLKGDNLLIVPDGELGYISFESLIRDFREMDGVNYAALPYLLHQYNISYLFSTDMWAVGRMYRGGKPRYAGFAPDYGQESRSTTRQPNGRSFAHLANADKEVQMIGNWFDGMAYIGNKATRMNFFLESRKQKLLHLAMHTELDTIDSSLSDLVFSTEEGLTDGAKLYHYEISRMDIRSPLVVLSACDTGAGELFKGEGVISLARSFLQAGALSAVQTLWPVDDAASLKIMSQFYRELSEGERKDMALKKAKLYYLDNSTPSFCHPYYWASYQLIGDRLALVVPYYKRPVTWLVAGALLVGLILGWAFLRYRFRRMV